MTTKRSKLIRIRNQIAKAIGSVKDYHEWELAEDMQRLEKEFVKQFKVLRQGCTEHEVEWEPIGKWQSLGNKYYVFKPCKICGFKVRMDDGDEPLPKGHEYMELEHWDSNPVSVEA